MKTITTHLPLESLACVTPECEWYGQTSQNNLNIRKWYGKANNIRYLKCKICQQEFSERKNTPLFNSKIREEKAISIAEHLSEGCSTQGTSRLVKVDLSTVRRLSQRLGKHGQQFHDQYVQNMEVTTLQVDERHGFAGKKKQPHWEAELIDPKSKFILAHVQGQRDKKLIHRLLQDGAPRLKNRHSVALFTDGFSAYGTLFPKLFGVSYQPKRRHNRGRPLVKAYPILRSLAHVQIIKHHVARRLQRLEIRVAYG
jgi:IS1 family transposase/transposase-like protein